MTNHRILLFLAVLTSACAVEGYQETSPTPSEEVATAEDELWVVRSSLPSKIRMFSTASGPPSCLGVVGASTANNARVVSVSCAAAATDWVTETTFAGTPYAVVVVRNLHTGKCLDAGTSHAQQYACHGGPVQQWRPLNNGPDLFGLHNDSRNRRLRTSVGLEWFQLDPSVASTRGLEFRARTGWCMDVPGFAQNTIPMQAYPCNSGSNQRFQLHPSGSNPGVFTIRPVHSGKCVEAMPGYRVAQFFACDDHYLQRWSLYYDLAAGDYSVVMYSNPWRGIVASGYDLDAISPPGRWLIR